MKQNYFTLLFLTLVATSALGQATNFPSFFPFRTPQARTVTNRSTSSAMQRAKAINQSAQTTYTHRIDSVIVTVDPISTSETQKYMQVVCKYNGNKLTEMNSNRWDNDSKTYILSYALKYAYDAQNRVDSFYTMSYSESNGEKGYGEAYHYNYDAANRISAVQELHWYGPTNVWTLFTTTYNQYAGANLSAEFIHNGESPELYAALFHSYDTCKNDTLQKKYYYWTGIQHLSSLNRLKYTYNSNNDIKESYDTNYSVDYNDSTVQKVNEIIHIVYDNNGNVDLYSDKSFSTSTGDVEYGMSLTTSDIDLNYKTSEILGYDKLDIPFYPKNMTRQWNTINNGTTLTYKLYYSPLIRDGLAQTPTTEGVKILAGSASGTVSLQMPTEAAYTVSIYNASGSQLQNLQTNGKLLTLSKLPAGVYFYNCHSETQNFKGKFIVQ